MKQNTPRLRIYREPTQTFRVVSPPNYAEYIAQHYRADGRARIVEGSRCPWQNIVLLIGVVLATAFLAYLI